MPHSYCYWRSAEWRSLEAYLALEQRIIALCDKLLHPDLRVAGDAASELSSIMCSRHIRTRRRTCITRSTRRSQRTSLSKARTAAAACVSFWT